MIIGPEEIYPRKAPMSYLMTGRTCHPTWWPREGGVIWKFPKIRGPQYRPQDIIILIMGTPKKVLLILGNPKA